MNKLLRKLYYRYIQGQQDGGDKKNANSPESQKVAAHITDNQAYIKEILGDSPDVVIRRFYLGIDQEEAFILFLEGMIDKEFLANNVMRSLMSPELVDINLPGGKSLARVVRKSLVAVAGITEVEDFNQVLSGVLAGKAALFVNGVNKAFIIAAEGFESRAIGEPNTEQVTKGPREAFSEPLGTNISLIRRRVQNPNLRIENFLIGKKTHTKIAIIYMKDLVKTEILTELRKRLARIDVDQITGAGNLEAYIEDEPFSPFATVNNTERPDVAAARMLEGRVVIFINGTPIALTVPYLFFEGFQSPEDYLHRFYYMTVTRWFRFIGFFITIYLPAFYISLVNFHQEMIPTPLLITIATAKEGTPFPILVEAVGMGIVFELLREAAIRMPRPVGQAVSIVGALVLGESAVSAGLVGAPIIVITALTAITYFMIPALLDVVLILRMLLILLAGISGLYGVFLVTMLFLIHLVSLRSFGIPYLAPLVPLDLAGLKDVLVRAPVWALENRPKALEPLDTRRQADKQKPGPNRGKQNSGGES